MIKSNYDTIIDQLGQIKQMLAKREHIDEAFKVLKEEFEGNGKIGFKAVRDKVIEWEDNKKYYTRVMVSLALTNLFALVLAVIAWFWKIAPILDALNNTRAGL